jgi:hypothetical protein
MRKPKPEEALTHWIEVKFFPSSSEQERDRAMTEARMEAWDLERQTKLVHSYAWRHRGGYAVLRAPEGNRGR